MLPESDSSILVHDPTKPTILVLSPLPCRRGTRIYTYNDKLDLLATKDFLEVRMRNFFKFFKKGGASMVVGLSCCGTRVVCFGFRRSDVVLVLNDWVVPQHKKMLCLVWLKEGKELIVSGDMATLKRITLK